MASESFLPLFTSWLKLVQSRALVRAFHPFSHFKMMENQQEMVELWRHVRFLPHPPLSFFRRLFDSLVLVISQIDRILNPWLAMLESNRNTKATELSESYREKKTYTEIWCFWASVRWTGIHSQCWVWVVGNLYSHVICQLGYVKRICSCWTFICHLIW